MKQLHFYIFLGITTKTKYACTTYACMSVAFSHFSDTNLFSVELFNAGCKAPSNRKTDRGNQNPIGRSADENQTVLDQFYRHEHDSKSRCDCRICKEITYRWMTYFWMYFSAVVSSLVFLQEEEQKNKLHLLSNLAEIIWLLMHLKAFIFLSSSDFFHLLVFFTAAVLFQQIEQCNWRGDKL